MFGWQQGSGSGYRVIGAALAVLLLLTACGSRVVNHAPVEDRSAPMGVPPPAPVAVEPSGTAVRQPPGFENAGKPGYYTVKPGDTLIRIGLDQGQNWRDIARWSGVENPNQIEVGQVLRVIPPVAAPVAVAVARPVTQSSVTPAATSPAPAQPASAPRAGSGAATPPASAAPAAAAPVKLTVFPAERLLTPDDRQQLQVTAHYGDGSWRDAQSLADQVGGGASRNRPAGLARWRRRGGRS